MKISKLERELKLFFEIFGLAALPGMLHAFILAPSLTTLPDAYIAVTFYIIYRITVRMREYVTGEEYELDKEIEKEDTKAKNSLKDYDHKP